MIAKLQRTTPPAKSSALLHSPQARQGIRPELPVSSLFPHVEIQRRLNFCETHDTLRSSRMRRSICCKRGALRNESYTGSTFGAVRAVECLAYALSGKNITFSLSSTPRFARTSSDGSSWSCQFNSSSFWSRFVISYGCVPSSPCHRHPLECHGRGRVRVSSSPTFFSEYLHRFR